MCDELLQTIKITNCYKWKKEKGGGGGAVVEDLKSKNYQRQ